MTSDEEKVLKVAKEIVVKFIEMGRISPSGFGKCFKEVFQVIKEVIEEEKENPDTRC